MSHAENDDRHPNRAEDRRQERIPYSPTRPLELAVSNPNGDISVRATARDDVLIRHVKYGRPGTRGYDEAEMVIAAHDNRIEVHPDLPGGSGWAGVSVNVNLNPFKRGAARAEAHGGGVHIGLAGQGDDVRFDIDIELPSAATLGRVEVRTASGDVAVEDLLGPVHLTTASGDARAARLGGALAVQTASGDLLVEGFTGRLTARTASGDTRIERAALDQFALHAVSGDVALDAALTARGPYHVESVSGDIRLALAPTAAGRESLTLAYRTVSGDASVGPPFRKIDRRTWRIGADEGGVNVAVKTVSGDLRVELGTGSRVEAPARFAPGESGSTAAAKVAPIAAVPAPVVPPVPDPPPAPAAPPAPEPPTIPDLESSAHDDASDHQPPVPAAGVDRLAVLEAVERGEIDVEEALRRLDAAGTMAGS